MNHDVKSTVRSFLNAMNREDFNTARELVTDDLTFIGVMGRRDGADMYFKDMEKMKFKYDVKKMISENNEVAVQYDINMGEKTLFCTGWYELKNGKISSFNVIFDPRPLLENKKG